MINLYTKHTKQNLIHFSWWPYCNNFNLQDKGLIGQKPIQSITQNYKLVSIKETENLGKWLYKQTLFYNFPLNIRVQMWFQGHQSTLNCDLMCLKRVADSLNISAELQPLGCRAIHPCPRGRIVADGFSSSMPAAFSGLWRLVKSVIDNWCSLGELQN